MLIHLNIKDMKILNIGTDTAPKWFAVATVSIDGKEQKIIPAFTEYSIQRKDFSKDKIYEKIDKSKILPTVFCFTKSEIFIKEKVRLFDYSGKELIDIPNEAPQIMVYLDKADNINLLGLDIPLKAELIDCKSVADAYHHVATTAYLSQCPSKDDWIGLAGIVSKDQLLLEIRRFGNTFGMNGTTAQGYFGLNTTTSYMQSKAISFSSLLPKGDFRTYQQAEVLMKATVQAFGAKAAKQTRYIKAINYCISLYSFDLVCKALNNIGATEKLQLDASLCEDKIHCLQSILIEQLTNLSNKTKQN